MEIFKIGSVDLSTNVVVPDYKVNRIPDYDSYEDCDYITHKFIKRQKVSGEFSLKFHSMDDFDVDGQVVHGYRTFVNLMNDSVHTDGSYTVTLYLNNTLDQYTGTFDLTYEASDSIPLYGIKDTETIKVTVTER